MTCATRTSMDLNSPLLLTLYHKTLDLQGLPTDWSSNFSFTGTFLENVYKLLFLREKIYTE